MPKALCNIKSLPWAAHPYCSA